jgi:type II secretory ATPase GspE/PulE/Tfp pilus assembly ATPase PilB-like protein
MTTLGPSLEDLLPNKKKPTDDSAAGKLSSKINEITLGEKEREIQGKAQSMGLAYFNLVGFPISPDALTTVDRKQSKANRVVCFFNSGQEIRLGAVDYNKQVKSIEKQIKDNSHANVSTYLISENSFNQAWKLYEALPKFREINRGVEIDAKDLENFSEDITDFRELDEKIQKTSVTNLVVLILAAAIKGRASDIHIEAEEKDIKVRYRIDGVLNDVASIDKSTWPKIISRIKQLAKLKINISNKPQDGRFSIFTPKDRIDVRVSALPTAFGESIVMRILLSSSINLSFEQLGLTGDAFKILEREISRPNGMIITTGPTGSGKTTTLYAILTKLNDPETKIITIEDPIEYELEGINQSQTNKDYQFAQGLKSIVRQDPDVIMVGEIRDNDTAAIAIQASLTGHLVLSTIHTNDAFGTIPRFISLDAKPFLLAPALNVAIGQRLVRRVCNNCKTEIELDPNSLERVKKIIASIPERSERKPTTEKLKFFKGRGCEKCQGLGYKGRIGIFEIMPIEGDIEEAIHKGNLSENEIKDLAQNEGILTMLQDGILKALDGVTSVEEIFRVTE